MSTTRHALRALLTAALAFAAVVWSAGPTGTPTATATVVATEAPAPAAEKAYPPAPCAHPEPHGQVQAVAWAEVARLHALGLPACDLVWSFSALPDGLWGIAYPTTDVDDRILIVIDPNPATYGDGFVEQDVRTTVRHEFGHALTYMLGFDDATLRETFDAELGGGHLSESSKLGFEASAEAIAEALTPEGEERTWFYDEVVDPQYVFAARYLLNTYWPQDFTHPDP